MTYLTKAEILAADDIETRPVDVPEWNGKVLVRGLSGKDRALFISSTIVQDGKNQITTLENVQAKLAALTIVDEEGQRLFPAAGDVLALGDKSGAALERVFEVASELSGLSNEDVENLAGNSGAATGGPLSDSITSG